MRLGTCCALLKAAVVISLFMHYLKEFFLPEERELIHYNDIKYLAIMFFLKNFPYLVPRTLSNPMSLAALEVSNRQSPSRQLHSSPVSIVILSRTEFNPIILC